MMTRSCFLLLALGMGAGCVELPLMLQPEQKPAPPIAAAVKKPSPATALVAPEEVTDANAREQADALQRELEKDSSGSAPAPTKAAEPMKKS